jgi:hypothetical protein
MHKYLRIQEAPQTDLITDDGFVGSKLPWPVTADEQGVVTVPCSIKMRQVVGFVRDLAKQQIDMWWAEAFADPSKIVGTYMVTAWHDGSHNIGLSAVDTAEFLETEIPIPVER